MGRVKKREGNFLEEMRDIISEIDDKKPEPEYCNVSCPPFGCPLGPCPGLCCNKGFCDSCCTSKMPQSPIPNCPARSSPTHTYPPPSCSIPSASTVEPYSNTRNSYIPKTHNRNRISNISVCQVPSTKPVMNSHTSHYHGPPYASHISQNTSAPQSCSSVIEIRYPEVIPGCFPPQSFTSKPSCQPNRSLSCPPPYFSGFTGTRGQENSPSGRPCRLPGPKICQPLSPYIVTIPYRKIT